MGGRRLNGELIWWCVLLAVNVYTFAVACIDVAQEKSKYFHRGLALFGAVLAGFCIAQILEVLS